MRCICDGELVCVRNEFVLLRDYKLWSADLYRCDRCGRYEARGVARKPLPDGAQIPGLHYVEPMARAAR